jgi:YD repeat-containing protein
MGSSSNASSYTPFQPAPILDGDGEVGTAPSSSKFYNAVGSPRFSPQETTPNSATKTKKNLGSYNYLFSAPVLSLGGRGIGVNLAANYNSRLWNKDIVGCNSTMTFNYEKAVPAPGHDDGYPATKTERGNITHVQTFSIVSPTEVSTTRYIKYDIFGNVVEAQLSCCVLRKYQFSGSTTGLYYSQPDWVKDGPSSGPNLTTSYLYDFETGLVESVTDPDGLPTQFQYDVAWRLKTVTLPSGAVTTTQFDRTADGNDQLAYSEKLTYTEPVTPPEEKKLVTKSWFDGAGRVIRSGSGKGDSPSSFDAVKILYDSLGRGLKQSNPYVGGQTGDGSPSYWTVNTYDILSRVTLVTLPSLPGSGSNTVQTSYAGATASSGAKVTVTDQVGRKRQSEVDGLGRLISVTEMNPATGQLDETGYKTTYSYSGLDNLTGVNQGNQTRSFDYDSLSRLTSQTTPEGGAVTFTYKDFDAVETHTDPRGVVTTYGYDGLNRLNSVSYNTVLGVTTSDTVSITYKQTSPGKGSVDIVTDSAGTEDYDYDSLGRVSTRSRTITGNSNTYTTSYEYNPAGQQTAIVYPSSKRVRYNSEECITSAM